MNSTDVREDSLQFLRDNFARIAILMVPIGVVWLGVSYLISLQFSGVSKAAISAVVDLFGYAYVEAATIIFIRRVLTGADPDTVAVLREAARYWPRLSLLIAIKIVAVIAGLVLLIVPGIVIAVRFSLAEQVLVIENSEVITSLKSSNEIATPIFGLVLRSLGVLFVASTLIVVALDYAFAYVWEYLTLLLFPVGTAITSIVTIAAYRIYSYVNSDRAVGA